MNKTKNAFSLIHLMMMLVTISLVALAMTPIVTGKSKMKATISTNQFACFYDNEGVLHQVTITNNKLVEDKTPPNNYCTFQTVKGVKTYNLKMVGAGGGGGGYLFNTKYKLTDTDARIVATNAGLQNVKVVNGQKYDNAAAFAGGVRHYFKNNFAGDSISILNLSKSDKDQTLDPYQGDVNASNVKNDAFWYDFASTLMRGVVLEQKSTCAIMEGGTCSKTHKITIGAEADNLIGIYVSDIYGFCKGGQCIDFTANSSNPDFVRTSNYCHSTCRSPSKCPTPPPENNCSEIRTTGTCTSGTLINCSTTTPAADIKLSYDYKFLRYGVAGGAGQYINEQEADFSLPKNPLPEVIITPGKRGVFNSASKKSTAGTNSEVSVGSSKVWTAKGGDKGVWSQGGVKKLYLIEDDKDIISPAKANMSDAPNIVIPTNNGTITLPKGNGGAGAGVDSYSCNRGFLAIGYPADKPTRVFVKKGTLENYTKTSWIIDLDVASWVNRPDENYAKCTDSTKPETPRRDGEDGENGFVVISW